MDDPHKPANEPGDAPLEEGNKSLLDDVAALLDDGRTLAEAEFAYQKARLTYAGRRGRNAIILVLLAVVLVAFALFGLVFGLILALTPYLSAWGATAVVVIGFLIIAAGCGLAAAGNLKLIRKAFKDNE